jgi:hypothetical protein
MMGSDVALVRLGGEAISCIPLPDASFKGKFAPVPMRQVNPSGGMDNVANRRMAVSVGNATPVFRSLY